jgi:hypothetical protein
MHVLWNSKVVAAPSYNTGGHTDSAPGWRAGHIVVSAVASSSIVEFADATTPFSNYASMVGNVSLAGDAKLYVPTRATMAPTGKLVAIVRNVNGGSFSDPGLRVRLYGTWKSVSYAPASTQLIGSGTVVNGQVVLKVHFPASLAGHAVPAYATLSGAGFIPVTTHLTVKVS